MFIRRYFALLLYSSAGKVLLRPLGALALVYWILDGRLAGGTASSLWPGSETDRTKTSGKKKWESPLTAAKNVHAPLEENWLKILEEVSGFWRLPKSGVWQRGRTCARRFTNPRGAEESRCFERDGVERFVETHRPPLVRGEDVPQEFKINQSQGEYVDFPVVHFLVFLAQNRSNTQCQADACSSGDVWPPNVYSQAINLFTPWTRNLFLCIFTCFKQHLLTCPIFLPFQVEFVSTTRACFRWCVLFQVYRYFELEIGQIDWNEVIFWVLFEFLQRRTNQKADVHVSPAQAPCKTEFLCKPSSPAGFQHRRRSRRWPGRNRRSSPLRSARTGCWRAKNNKTNKEIKRCWLARYLQLRDAVDNRLTFKSRWMSILEWMYSTPLTNCCAMFRLSSLLLKSRRDFFGFWVFLSSIHNRSVLGSHSSIWMYRYFWGALSLPLKQDLL